MYILLLDNYTDIDPKQAVKGHWVIFIWSFGHLFIWSFIHLAIWSFWSFRHLVMWSLVIWSFIIQSSLVGDNQGKI